MFPSLIGLKVAAIATATSLIVGFGAGWTVHGWKIKADALKAAQGEIKRAERVIQDQGKRAAVTTDVERKTAEKVETVRYVTRTIVQKVPEYVTPATDARFPLPVGLVRVYDASALGVDVSAVPLPAGKSDGDPSDVTASRAALTFAENNGTCLAVRSTLLGLQEWVRQQQGVQ